MKKARGTPCLISQSAPQTVLERIVLGTGNYSEDWLQNLIHNHPEILPIDHIEPGFGRLFPIAREVPCGHGYIDNLYLTPTGEIIVVEAKLWANPQARREVVAQALDYVAALMMLSYSDFEMAVAKAPGGPSTLYPCVADNAEVLTESAFIDAVSNNLARGRILVLVVGDGIRREAEALGALLQSHAGAHFTFALVELATWRNSTTGDILVVPDTLAQTVMIERGVVRLVNGAMQVQPAPAKASMKAKSISEEMYYEELAKKFPSMPSLLQAFLNLVEPLGIYADLQASLNLKAELPEYAKPMNFGYITRTGKLWTDPLSWFAPKDVADRYHQTLADLIGGSVVTLNSGGRYVSTNGKSGPHLTDLLPKHAEAWAAAIRQAIDDIRKRNIQVVQLSD